MLKKIGMMVASICLALSSYCDDGVTGRYTWNGVEWLYTIYHDEHRIVLEKAILLTADQYHPVLNFHDVISDVNYGFNSSTGKWPYQEHNEWDIWFGVSAFEGNEYLQGITFEAPFSNEITVNLTFCQNSFKGCKNFNGFDIATFEGELRIKSIEQSAFEESNFGFNFRYAYQWQVFTSITNIGSQAFYECYCINSDYRMDLDITKTNAQFSEGSFSHCGCFNNIYLPENLKEIPSRMFEGCYSIVHLNANIESISEYAFSDCMMKDELVLPEGLKYVGSSAFWGAHYKTLVLPSSLEKIGSGAFSGSKKGWYPYVFGSELAGEVVIPSNVEIGSSAFKSNPLLKRIVISDGVKALPTGMFGYCLGLEEVVVPNSVTSLGEDVFHDCTNLTVKIPASVLSVSEGGVWGGEYGTPKEIIFEGAPPSGISKSKLLDAKIVYVPIEYKSQWAPYFRPNMKFAKKVDGEWVALGGKVISNAMRPSDPTIMDIKYKVTSTKDKVNVRILAFEDGNRSFAKVLRPETFVDGTEANVGDGVAANVEHTVSWQVSKDWDVDLAKVSIEVYVQEDNLLPLQLTTIPAMGERASVTFSRNVPDRDKVMNALYWLYADKMADLTLANGVLKCGNTQLVNGSTLSDANAVSYIYSKMGYGTLSGDTLKYVNELMRTKLNPSGLTQYAVKEGAAQ